MLSSMAILFRADGPALLFHPAKYIGKHVNLSAANGQKERSSSLARKNKSVKSDLLMTNDIRTGAIAINLDREYLRAGESEKATNRATELS